MDKHFTITIHDEHGTKQFNIHKMLKHALLYFFSFLIIFIILAVGVILYLQNDLQQMQHKRTVEQNAYMKLKAQNTQLAHQMQETQHYLSMKKKELDELADSLNEIEMLMGLKPLDANASLQNHIDITKQTTQQRRTLLQLIPNGSPIEYHGITSKFGYRIHPMQHKREFHRGSDMKAKRGTPVYAPADGIVEWAGYHKRSGFGNLVILQHIYGFKTYYGHLKKVNVRLGQFVKKGDLIAYTGNSGMSNGPHLHYEIRFLQRPLNPYYFIQWTQSNYCQIFQKEKKVPWESLVQAINQMKILKPTAMPNTPIISEKTNKFIPKQVGK